jgi:N-acetylneuraminic acid mutarotase
MTTRRAALAWLLIAGLGMALDGCRRTGQVNNGGSAGGSGAWTWIGGSASAGDSGVYGSLNTPAATNLPGARQGAATWRDASGNLWLFGGLGVDGVGNTGYLNDLWRYAPGTATWTWVGGSDVANGAGVYGTRTVGSGTNLPGGRVAGASWTDSQGRFWLLGGAGLDSNSIALGPLNDLWEYDPSAGTWTWQSGASTYGGATASYGSVGIAAASNVPGGRKAAQAWADASDTLWLFGGNGEDASGNLGYLADLWSYSTLSGQWTWVGGSSAANPSGDYGTQGAGTVSTMPGGRNGAAVWFDGSGNTWLFGGQGYDASGASGYLSDLWQWNPHTATWTWIGGSSAAGTAANYGSLGASAAANLPGGRIGAAAWIDASGRLAMTGGVGNDSTGIAGYLNDVWRYETSTKNWSWTGGANVANQSGTYGSKGTAAANNTPGGRDGAARWVDPADHLWLFGGIGYDATTVTAGTLGDLWTLAP